MYIKIVKVLHSSFVNDISSTSNVKKKSLNDEEKLEIKSYLQ